MTDHAPNALRLLGEKTFSELDQRRFAAASHDWNPMHMDAVAARRLLSGRQVVHGIHTLIHALNLWSPSTKGPLAFDLACNFAHPVNVGDRVVFGQADEVDGCTRIVASVQDLVCTEVLIKAMPSADGVAARLSGSPTRYIGKIGAPLDEVPGSQAGSILEIETCSDSLAGTFPQAAEVLGVEGLSAVARLSFFVGMVCPGLHSVFSSVRFTTGAPTVQRLRFELQKYDPRFRLFTVAFDGPLNGEIRAFLRPPPQSQPSAAKVARQLAGDEFKGTRSLVIGGSRGLGETTAKIIAAGGGDVVVTYAMGSDDADTVAADINASGRGRCEVAHLDLRGNFQSSIDPVGLHAVYFFATPRIYAKRNEVFDRAAFDEFVGFYLQRFYELCRWLEGVERPVPIKVYLPSTVFIAERPKGMTEYAMAKAAAEVLADDLNRNLRNVSVVHTRLPRLATDQTASILKVSVESNLDALLSVVRQVSG